MKLLFLAYLNRSGSTFLADLLSRDPRFCVCPEAHRPLRRILARSTGPLGSEGRTRLLSDLRSDAKLASWGLGDLDEGLISAEETGWKTFLGLLREYRERTLPGADAVVVKGAFFLELLGRAPEPEFHLVALARDPRAIFASQRKAVSTNTGLPMALDPFALGRRWRRFMERVEGVRGDPRVLVLRYEEMVADPEGTVGGVLAAMGLSPQMPNEGAGEPAPLLERIPSPQRHLHQRVGGEADPSRIEGWRNDLSTLEVDLVQRGAGPMLEKAGYRLEDSAASPLVRLAGRVVFSVRELLLKLRRRIGG